MAENTSTAAQRSAEHKAFAPLDPTLQYVLARRVILARVSTVVEEPSLAHSEVPGEAGARRVPRQLLR
jgi:hypothetical protein